MSHWLWYGVAGWLLCCGVYGIATSRHYLHQVLCLSVVQASTYILLILAGFRRGGTAPVFYDVAPGTLTVDPIVHALLLTDVVVGATVTALLLALVMDVHKRLGNVDPEQGGPMRG